MVPEVTQPREELVVPDLPGHVRAAQRGTASEFQTNGESYFKIIKYCIPEFITTLILYAVLNLLDAHWVAHLKSTSAYAICGTTSTLFHFITKMGEGLSVGTVILVGHYNGLGDVKKAGKILSCAFWVTLAVGSALALFFYAGAYAFFCVLRVPSKMVALGVPYLQMKALSILLMFIFFSTVGFLRGIKNTRVPMIIGMIGAAAFVFFDYALIFGRWGFGTYGLQGSAIASVIQYSVMVSLSLAYLLFYSENRKYCITLFSQFPDLKSSKDLIVLSAPVMLDKSLLAGSYLWLGFLINPMGKYVIASYTVIKDLERLAIQPAAACAQVITFLVSNAYSVGDWRGIKATLRRIMILSSVCVFSLLVLFCFYSRSIISFFDQKGKFTEFSSTVFPLISVMAFFDLLQLILSGALRGAANVRLVMAVRLGACVLYFVPVSWMLSRMVFDDIMVKFLLIYGSFYFGNLLMSYIYIQRFRGDRWQLKTVD